jgi:hypothetical protein
MIGCRDEAIDSQVGCNVPCLWRLPTPVREVSKDEVVELMEENTTDLTIPKGTKKLWIPI